MSNELGERKQKILKAVIDTHIACGEPVGSKLLAANTQIALSSATIRNELAELTEMGYLIQPHTSAGRIPTERAYRYYVNSLIDGYDRTVSEIHGLNELLRVKTAQLDRIIDDAGRLISTLTNYPAFAVRAKPKRQTVRTFNLMRIDAYSFLLIMILSETNVKTRTVQTPIPLSDEELQLIRQILNRNLAGADPDKLTLAQLLEIENAMGHLGSLASPIIKCIHGALAEDEDSDLRVEGVDRFLEYPEFSSVDRLRSMLEMLSNKKELLEMVEHATGDDINVFIGSENSADQTGDSTLIFKTITVDGKSLGAIGVIGPCRMNYSKVISTMEQLAESIRDMMNPGRSLPDPTGKKETGRR